MAFLVRLGLNFHPMGELRGEVDWASDIFVTDGQKSDYLSRASQRARGATKNQDTRLLSVTSPKCYRFLQEALLSQRDRATFGLSKSLSEKLIQKVKSPTAS